MKRKLITSIWANNEPPANIPDRAQVQEITNMAVDRLELAKALIRASDKPAKPTKTKGGKDKTRKSAADGDGTTAA